MYDCIFCQKFPKGGFEKTIGILGLYIKAYVHLGCLAAKVVTNPCKRDVLIYNVAAKPLMQSEISLQRISSIRYVYSFTITSAVCRM